MSIYILAICWLCAVILIILAVNGWLINFLYAIRVVIGAFIDVACQAWLDISKLWERKVKLDDHEQHIS